MSETTTSAVMAANSAGASEAELQAAAIAANNAPAPANAIEAFMQNITARIGAVEGVLGMVAPLENIVLTGVETIAPASVPIISAVSELQSIVTSMLSSFAGAFGGKVAMPQAPLVAPHPSLAVGGAPVATSG